MFLLITRKFHLEKVKIFEKVKKISNTNKKALEKATQKIIEEVTTATRSRKNIATNKEN